MGAKEKKLLPIEVKAIATSQGSLTNSKVGLLLKFQTIGRCCTTKKTRLLPNKNSNKFYYKKKTSCLPKQKTLYKKYSPPQKKKTCLPALKRKTKKPPLRRFPPRAAEHVWRFGAVGARPRVAVLGGVHGNELAGVEASSFFVFFEPFFLKVFFCCFLVFK